jgi:uncharacterized protein YndB with AHSA1/START domain
MSDNSVSLHRVFAAPPSKVFRAFTDANAMASWLPPYGFVCQVHHMETKVGGTYRMSFFNFTTGNGHAFGGKYVEIKQNERLVYTDKFEDPNLPGEMTTTVSLREAIGGNCEIKISQTGIPPQIPADMCYMGWQDSLEKLKRLVEPNIPDA